eukprot:TRINITY_DN7258_c0_g1_i2.p3 TRINITY_DN7258_c0_g1~~TRINITY_DN7258_c0_g1_i2.p3  ORF type:complete len:226 (-),score=-25.40 TRINITY_DN7258_c0_g1_i2:469-1146(-)
MILTFVYMGKKIIHNACIYSGLFFQYAIYHNIMLQYSMYQQFYFIVITKIVYIISGYFQKIDYQKHLFKKLGQFFSNRLLLFDVFCFPILYQFLLSLINNIMYTYKQINDFNVSSLLLQQKQFFVSFQHVLLQSTLYCCMVFIFVTYKLYILLYINNQSFVRLYLYQYVQANYNQCINIIQFTEIYCKQLLIVDYIQLLLFINKLQNNLLCTQKESLQVDITTST